MVPYVIITCILFASICFNVFSYVKNVIASNENFSQLASAFAIYNLFCIRQLKLINKYQQVHVLVFRL